jgi:UDP-N-acetylglucosamine 2-epimerase
MIGVIREYENSPNIKVFKSIPSKDFFSLMKNASLVIGNSSSGIVEAPSFHIPVINIGSRQDGRERAKGVIDTGYDKDAIKAAIKKALYDERFIKIVKTCRNPYEMGDAASKIATVLASIPINNRLLQKKLRY